MFVIEFRNRTDHVKTVRGSVKVKTYKEAEAKIVKANPGVVFRSARPKPGKKINTVTMTTRDKIYSVKKIG